MEKEEIKIGDLHRLLLGEAPVSFLLEALGRAILVLLAFVVVSRLLGKRMNSQLTVTEMAVMVSLGAIIAPVMLLAERGILMGITVLLFALAFQKILTRADFGSESFERLSQGAETVLVEDGVMNISNLHGARISREQLFGILRSHDIRHLGEVERLYLEACGTFSLFKSDPPAPGMSLYAGETSTAGEPAMNGSSGVLACNNCGTTCADDSHSDRCPGCGASVWEPAIQ